MKSAFPKIQGREWAAALFLIPLITFAPEPLNAQPQLPPDLTVPSGLKADRFAAEPMLASPVALGVDDQGRVYVTQTVRRKNGSVDIRQHWDWLNQELSFESVEDRAEFYKEMMAPSRSDETRSFLNDYNGDGSHDYRDLSGQSDYIHLLEDLDGDFKADRSQIFAEGFTNITAGVAAGVMPYDGDVYVTMAPDLWKLRDTNGDGKADRRESLSYGYGVHMGYGGHNMHGLIVGPDGKIYWSIADIGFNVTTKEGRHFVYPHEGAVLRCNPDGSEVEVVAHGLRNPQELAFDKYGNLFTGDNDSDKGDQERWVYVVEGGDSGWRCHWQYQDNYQTWLEEKLWHKAFPNQAAYIVPPVGHIGNGPCGLVYYPGTGWSDQYEDHFFLAHFAGAASNSGVNTYAVRLEGASFELIKNERFIDKIAATGLEFGPAGNLYIADWVGGWNVHDEGRVYRVYDPDRIQSTEVNETRRLLNEGMDGRSRRELAGLLSHKDQRVRQAAQFALVDQGPEARSLLARVAKKSEHQLARIHAVWGLGQLNRQQAEEEGTRNILKPLLALLEDSDSEIRAQAAKVLGEAEWKAAYQPLNQGLTDPNARVRYFSAMGLGKIGNAHAVPAILEFLQANAESDPYLRHAGIMALTWIDDRRAIFDLVDHPDRQVRLAAVVALRKLNSPEVTRFLDDPDPWVVLEAARAINDVPIDPAMPQLAALIKRPLSREPLARRVINAVFRQGTADAARRLADFTVRKENRTSMRLLALNQLAQWPEPNPIDPISGAWRPLENRPAETARDALRSVLDSLLAIEVGEIREAVAQLCGQYQVKEAGDTLHAWVKGQEQTSAVRVASLNALRELNDDRLVQAVNTAVTSQAPELRRAGMALAAQLNPAQATEPVRLALETGPVPDRKWALNTLGELNHDRASAILADWMKRFLQGDVDPAIQLELLQAAKQSSNSEVQALVARYEDRIKEQPKAAFDVALKGGNADAGRKVFFEKTVAQCVRCHAYDGQGSDVGPDLTGIGQRQSRDYILEAIVSPNQTIAEGFENVRVTTEDGQSYTGRIARETDQQLELIVTINDEESVLSGEPAKTKTVTLSKDRIQSRAEALSAMPEGLAYVMSKSELRDLVEFLVSNQGNEH